MVQEMRFIHAFWQFSKVFFQPNVSVFIAIGAGVMFLTFFTHDNALEIAISGIASVFIGIAVNNFTIVDIHKKDEQIIRAKVTNSMKVLEMTEEKIERAQMDLASGNHQQLIHHFAELRQFMILMKELLKEEESFD